MGGVGGPNGETTKQPIDGRGQTCAMNQGVAKSGHVKFESPKWCYVGGPCLQGGRRKGDRLIAGPEG